MTENDADAWAGGALLVLLVLGGTTIVLGICDLFARALRAL